MKADIYQRIANQIVEKFEQGVRPWHQPWKAEHSTGHISRPLRANGTPYNGINVLMLWSAAIERGHGVPIWMTFKQANELGAHVRKGETGTIVVYADKIIRNETNAETGDEAERAIPFMKGYTVFDVGQIDGLPMHYYGEPAQPIDPLQHIAHADAFFATRPPTAPSVRRLATDEGQGCGGLRVSSLPRRHENPSLSATDFQQRKSPSKSVAS